MNAAMVASIIQLILVPVVMITACAITQGGLLGHYAVINERLRSSVRERLQLLQDEPDSTGGTFHIERLHVLDYQIPDLLHRHKLAHDAVLVIYCAILLFVVDMFVIAGAVTTDSSGVATVALVIFMLSTCVMLVGVFLVAVEIRTSHRAVSYEVQRVIRLKSGEESLLQPAAVPPPPTPIKT